MKESSKIQNKSGNEKKGVIRLLNFFAFSLLLSIIPARNIYFENIQRTGNPPVKKEIILPTPPPFPVNITKVEPPYISAEAVIIRDMISGELIYAKNENSRMSPASTTKIMTALVILDKYTPDDIFTVKSTVIEGRNMGLHIGEQLTVEALLYGTLVHSANDAALVLAQNYEAGEEKFIEAMNSKAKTLNLANTHFTNPIGFDDPDHYSTAYDLAKLSYNALENKYFMKIVSTKSITVSDITYSNFYELRNVNELLGKVAGLSGVKTGYTQNAGEILISEVKKNGHSVLFTVLKSSDRFGETLKLIDWVFGNFQWQTITQTN